MEILFKRDQVRGKFKGVRFKLWSKLELDENEKSVINHYSFDQAVLIDSLQPKLIRNTAFVSFGAFVGASIILWTIFSFSVATFLGLVAGAAAGYFYYDKNRETVYVKDLLYGRYFNCDSVIELARKEAWLETITAFLRQVMESAKHWDGTEARPIEVLSKDEAKSMIIRGL